MDSHLHHRRDSDAPLPSSIGMSEEQLAFFTNQTQRATAKGVKRYRNQALVGFGILMVGVALALSATSRTGEDAREATINSGRAVAVEGCNRDYLDRLTFRQLLERLKDAAEASKTSTSAQKALAVAFYDGQLDRFVLPDCRESQRLLTSDPEARIPEIAPFYPGAPYVPDPSGG